GAQTLQECKGTRTANFDLGEARLVKEGCGLACGEALRADGGRPVLPCPAAWPEAGVTGCSIRFEPVGPLPAGLLAECATELGEARVGRGDTQRTAGLALLVRVVDVVVGGIDLGRASQGVAARAVLRSEAADVHGPQVELGFAGDDPLRHLASHAAGAGDAMGREPRRHEEAPHLRLAEDE